MINWLNEWNLKASQDNIFDQMGRRGYTPYMYFLMLSEIQKSLQLNKDDIFLDIGCCNGFVGYWASPLVKEVHMLDYADKFIEMIKPSMNHYENIYVYQDDILELKSIRHKKFTKVHVGAVLSSLRNAKEAKTALQNVFEILEIGGKAYFTHNPLMEHRERYLRMWDDKLKMICENDVKTREFLVHCKECEHSRLWMEIEQIEAITQMIGYSRSICYPINSLLPQCTHMFDFIVEK